MAQHQFGVFSRQQARQAGLSRHQMDTRLGNGRWETLHPGVFRLRGAPDSPAATAVAGLLYAGAQAWFSHATSARLHGIEPHLWHRWIWITVPVAVQRLARPGLKIVRSRRIDGFTATAHGHPVMSAERSVVDLAALLDPPVYQQVLYDVVSREVVTVDGILAAADDFGGRCGIALVHQAISEFDPTFESGVEYEADALFRAAGLVFERQVEIRDNGILLARLDFADEGIKLGVEIDGVRYHSSAQARHYDRERDRALRRRGWQVERFTTNDVRQRPRSMQRHLVEVYRERSSGLRLAS